MSVVAPVLLCVMTGCATVAGFTPPWSKTQAKDAKSDGPKDSGTLTSRGFERGPMDPKLRQDLDAAQRLMQDKKYAEAEQLYQKLAAPGAEANWWNLGLLDTSGESGKKDRKYSRDVFEEALFGAAECQRFQKNYRTSADTYTNLLVKFPHSQYTPRVCQGLFEIADHWLEPTRRQMDEYQEQLQGKRWMVTPAMYVSFNNDMPFLDAEGHAARILNTIQEHDVNGDMRKKALFYLGTINFYRRDYKEADLFFTQLHTHYKDSPEASKAIKQSIICKQLSTGGSVYDLRPVEESKRLLMTAQGAYPEFVKDQDWVKHQLISMNYQQAERDFKIGEFYQRTGHPGSAYFYFELVCRRYPGTKFATDAAQRKNDLKSKTEKEQNVAGTPQPNATSPQVRPGLSNDPQPRTLPPLDPGRDR